MKNFIKRILQRLLGFENYLYYFSIFIIATLKRNRREGDFMHFLTIIPGRGSILDIGANIGAMTVHLARRFPNSEIYAFEPVPYNLNTLKRIIKHYKLKNVIISETALGDFTGTVQMVVPTLGKAKQHGLSHVVDDSITTFNEGEMLDTPITRLDDIAAVNHENITISAIKLDVENFEYRVLKGAENLINRHKPVVYCELWENENRGQCFTFMKSLGYSVFILEKKKLVIFNPQLHTTQNFFFVHKTSNENIR